jgi:hypothetical protein
LVIPFPQCHLLIFNIFAFTVSIDEGAADSPLPEVVRPSKHFYDFIAEVRPDLE